MVSAPSSHGGVQVGASSPLAMHHLGLGVVLFKVAYLGLNFGLWTATLDGVKHPLPLAAFPHFGIHIEEDRTSSWHNNQRQVRVHDHPSGHVSWDLGYSPPAAHPVGLGVGALQGCWFGFEFWPPWMAKHPPLAAFFPDDIREGQDT
ncbi:hypothetical protein THAOC_14574 [Thalassiosira oceanica]|uniref:Uncharacterized protein n=1 Tax=Thalassiosira oceanica TaxID=159749 RepID=K0SI85_THAOC|nr:hypothetical protein THAOC_14574 [Thalassiosira oceanica]|eukprot:EJK64669.1 hypothetical protein THAOC_14574 [Thalassiosira oceanica]